MIAGGFGCIGAKTARDHGFASQARSAGTVTTSSATGTMWHGCGSFAVSCVLVWCLGYLRGSRRVRGWVRLPFLTVLMCEIGTRGREASVEGYAVDGLAVSGEPAGPAAGRGLAELEAAGNAVAPGLGPLVVRVAVMYEGAAGAVLLDDMERLAVEESRKIGLGALQLTMDAQADAEIDLPRAFRTADLWLIHAADCCSRYSSWTCCGVRY